MNSAPFLVADIGGTVSRLALADGPALRRASVRRFSNDAAEGIAGVLRGYVREADGRPGAVCVAAAGPVEDDAVRLTNRDWTVTRAGIAEATGCDDVVLINDLQAMGFALAVPEIAGAPLRQTRLVLALGTGINAAVTHPLPGGGVLVPPGEHGYVSLPFARPEDAGLLAALARDFGAPVIEAALSGPGLTRLHQLLTGQRRSPEDITAERPGTEATLAAGLRLLGAYLGSLALLHLPRGGSYLAGSVGRALSRHLQRSEFRDAFADRGAYGGLVQAMPLRVIESDDASLHGAALCLAQRQGSR